jgi:hypothetical protein
MEVVPMIGGSLAANPHQIPRSPENGPAFNAASSRIGATGATGIDRQAHAGIRLPTGATSPANDVKGHRDEIAQCDHLDIRALFYHFARDLVPEHHSSRGSCAAANHVLIGSADIGRNHLQDHAMLDLAASRFFRS